MSFQHIIDLNSHLFNLEKERLKIDKKLRKTKDSQEGVELINKSIENLQKESAIIQQIILEIEKDHDFEKTYKSLEILKDGAGWDKYFYQEKINFYKKIEEFLKEKGQIEQHYGRVIFELNELIKSIQKESNFEFKKYKQVMDLLKENSDFPMFKELTKQSFVSIIDWIKKMPKIICSKDIVTSRESRKRMRDAFFVLATFTLLIILLINFVFVAVIGNLAPIGFSILKFLGLFGFVGTMITGLRQLLSRKYSKIHKALNKIE